MSDKHCIVRVDPFYFSVDDIMIMGKVCLDRAAQTFRALELITFHQLTLEQLSEHLVITNCMLHIVKMDMKSCT